MDIRTINGDANVEIPKIIKNIKTMDAKGVIFLDPYHTNVEWNTIKEIGKCGCLDFWYLFPLSAFMRMLPKNGDVPEEWKSKISNLCGCSDNIWFDRIYQKKTKYQMSLFDQDKEPPFEKTINVYGLADFVIDRLKTVFPFVCDEKKILVNSKKSPLFILLFATSAKNDKGQNLAKKIAREIINHAK